MNHKHLGLGLSLLLTGTTIAQQNPTGSPVPGTYTTAQQAASAWYRGGNLSGNTAGTNNLLGTAWNSPIYFITNGNSSTNYRMKLNGDYTSGQYLINGFGAADGVNTTGYLLLGNDVNAFYTAKGAYSLLHLNGQDATGIGNVQEFGYRTWMKTGITYSGNSDLSYMGLRQVGTGTDITETVISWADNAGTISGPDELAFRYTQGTKDDGGSTVSTNFNDPTDIDGRNVARFTGEGRMGLGNTFGVNVTGINPAYIRPQSLLHMSFQYLDGTAASEPYGFMQITYRRAYNAASDIIGQGEAATDGLRLGIDNEINNINGVANFLNGYLRWQEASNFIIQTEDGGSPNIDANERMRITSVGALVATQGAGYGGLTSPSYTTRVSISANGVLPVNRPLSLLHLGYNAATTDGWRSWMDIGTFTSSGSDHIYVGLKPENGTASDKYDAVLGWGDNQSNLPSNSGPDNLRMIFTSSTNSAAGGTAPATGTNGLEGMRMTPTTNVGIYTGIGGDPTSNQYYGASQNPTRTLEVNSWGAVSDPGGSSGLRFTDLNTSSPTVTNPGPGVLSVNDSGDVIYVEFPEPQAVDTSGLFGVPCADTVNGILDQDRKIHTNDHNFYFVDNDVNSVNNNVGFGWDCGTTLKAKVDAVMYGPQGIAGSFITFNEIGGIGVRGFANELNSNGTEFVGVLGAVSGSNSAIKYSVRGVSSGTPNSWAGYFDGDVEVMGAFINPSDRKFKTDVKELDGALEKLQELRPVSYYMDTVKYESFRFDGQQQYGFIAQEVEKVFPSIVHNSVNSGGYDKEGNHIHNPIEYKSLNYIEFIPINTQAILELNEKVESKDATIQALTATNEAQQKTIDDLNNRLSQLENCLSGVLPYLCQMSQNAIEANTPEAQEAIRAQLSVKLTNRDVIVLDQNVPNPFAEQTVINFSIPETIQKAQIHFYDGQGKLLQSVDVEARGLGSLTVFGADLSRGAYTYTLVADGQIVASKKMVKQ